MAGAVRAHLIAHLDQSYDVHPIDCPTGVERDGGAPRCYTVMFDGERRACIYWRACTMPSNETHRIDPSALAKETFLRTATTMRCNVICSRARSNRPPGC